MKLKIKQVELAIVFAIITGFSVAHFVGGSRVMQAVMMALVSGYVLLAWEVRRLQREVQQLRETNCGSKV